MRMLRGLTPLLLVLVGCSSGDRPAAPAPTPRPVTLSLEEQYVHGNDTRAVAFSPDGGLLATAGENIGGPATISLRVIPGFGEIESWEAYPFAAYALAFSPDGGLLVSSGYDKYVGSSGVDSTARLWRRADGAAHRTFYQEDWVFGVAFSPDSTLLASAGYAGVRLYRVDGDDAPEFTASPPEPATAAAFSPDGQWLVTTRADSVESTPGTVNVWRVQRE